MLEFSFPELVVVFVVALLVLGPERLPKVARTIGHLLGRARSMWQQAQEEIEREIRQPQQDSLREIEELRRTGLELERELRKDIQPPPPPESPGGSAPDAPRDKPQ